MVFNSCIGNSNKVRFKNPHSKSQGAVLEDQKHSPCYAVDYSNKHQKTAYLVSGQCEASTTRINFQTK